MFKTVFIVKIFYRNKKNLILLKLESFYALYELHAFRSNFLSNPQVEQTKVFQYLLAKN